MSGKHTPGPNDGDIRKTCEHLLDVIDVMRTYLPESGSLSSSMPVPALCWAKWGTRIEQAKATLAAAPDTAAERDRLAEEVKMLRERLDDLAGNDWLREYVENYKPDCDERITTLEAIDAARAALERKP